jgi:toxin FitB
VVAGYLLDTNVVDELRKRDPDPRVAAWFDTVSPDDVHLSVLVVGEIRQRIERLRRRDPKQAAVYDGWLDELLVGYVGRFAPIDMEVAEEWGRLRRERSLPQLPGLLAATARVHKWTLVTRNVGDYPPDVALLNPFEPPE